MWFEIALAVACYLNAAILGWVIVKDVRQRREDRFVLLGNAFLAWMIAGSYVV